MNGFQRGWEDLRVAIGLTIIGWALSVMPRSESIKLAEIILPYLKNLKEGA